MLCSSVLGFLLRAILHLYLFKPLPLLFSVILCSWCHHRPSEVLATDFWLRGTSHDLSHSSRIKLTTPTDLLCLKLPQSRMPWSH